MTFALRNMPGRFIVQRARQPAPASPNTLLTIRADQCKWPIGEGCGRATLFCGEPVNMPPYCARHRTLAYQPRRPTIGAEA